MLDDLICMDQIEGLVSVRQTVFQVCAGYVNAESSGCSGAPRIDLNPVDARCDHVTGQGSGESAVSTAAVEQLDIAHSGNGIENYLTVELLGLPKYTHEIGTERPLEPLTGRDAESRHPILLGGWSRN